MRKRAAQIRESLHPAPSAARPRPRSGEKGYILLTLLLVIALAAVVVMFGIIIPIQAEYQREQETEMIHRGVQYSRAIKNYYKKFSRYPTKLDDLDNTNNMRYLRKHYKDPLNCKNGKCQDFRLLHYGEPGVTLGGGFSIGGGSIPGASAVGSPAGQTSFGGSSSSFGNSGFGASGSGNSGFGGSGSSGSGFGNSGFGNSGVNSSGVFSQSNGSAYGSGGNSSGGFGAGSNSQTGSDQQATGQQGTNSASGPDSSQAPQTPGEQGDASSGGQQLVVGGPIVGVASLCKKTTIREYNHKKKYNEWQFLYDPSLDRGGIITTPYQPSLQAFGAQQNLNGAQPAAGTNGSPLGGSSSSPFGGTGGSSFGNSNGSSFGQSSTFGNSGSSSSPPQPPANPPQ
jgi:type II secretory pathway pseudopilin PulG